MSILKELLNPPNKYRSIPFWSWNDEIEEEELRRQIREMHKTGHGGYFMHVNGRFVKDLLWVPFEADIK